MYKRQVFYGASARNYLPWGFTLIELVVTVAIVGILALVAMPMLEMNVKRQKETELRAALREIRGGIDAYRRALDEGKLEKKVAESGYPHRLEELYLGVENIQDPNKVKSSFCADCRATRSAPIPRKRLCRPGASAAMAARPMRRPKAPMSSTSIRCPAGWD